MTLVNLHQRALMARNVAAQLVGHKHHASPVLRQWFPIGIYTFFQLRGLPGLHASQSTPTLQCRDDRLVLHATVTCLGTHDLICAVIEPLGSCNISCNMTRKWCRAMQQCPTCIQCMIGIPLSDWPATACIDLCMFREQASVCSQIKCLIVPLACLECMSDQSDRKSRLADRA